MRDVDAILKEWYEGELGGNALFSALAVGRSPEVAGKWRALAAVEAAVASILASTLGGDLPVPPNDRVQERARQRCASVATHSWPETMQWLRGIAVAALREMESDAERLPPALAAVGDLVVRHEIALIAFAELELAGRPAESLRPIESFLDSIP